MPGGKMAYESRLSLEIDSRSGEASLRRMEGRLQGVERAGEGVSRVMGGMRTAIGLAAAAAGGLSFGRLITETASLEDSMLGLQAVSRATAAQMQQLEKQARTLGATSMFSAKQAGDAQRFLAQAGLEVNEVLSATPGILQLATASQMGLAEAADAASNILGGMRLEVDQLNRVNDVLAATAAGSNTSVSQLAQALSTAAPLAAAAGISIEETAAAIGVMSDAGIQASRAGTGLQGVIRQLSNVTPQAEAALAQYGLSLEQVNVETYGLSTVLETLQQANISTADAFKIFGSEAGAAAQILVSGNARVEEFTASLGDAEGEAERMANVIGSGLTGSMRGFNSMLSETLISLGKDEGVAGGFQSVIDTGSGLLAVYNDLLPEFAEANDLTEDQASRLETLAGGLQNTATIAGAAAGAYVAYRGAVMAATVAQTAFNVAVRANPIGLLITAAGTAVGALYTFREELGLVDGTARRATEALDANSQAIRDGSQAALDSSHEALTLSLDEVSTKSQLAMTRLLDLEATQRFLEKGGSPAAEGAAAEISLLHDKMAGLWETQAGLMRQIEENRARREELRKEHKAGAEQLDTLTVTAERAAGGMRETAKATTTAAKAASGYADELESLRRELDPAYAAGQKLAESTELLDAGLANGTVTLTEYLDLWGKAADVYGEATTGTDDQAKSLESLAGKYDRHHQKAAQLEKDLKAINKQYKAGEIGGQKYQRMVGNVREEMHDLSLEADPMAQEMARAWEEAANRIDETFADAFAGAFDSFDDFSDQILDGFKRLLAELAYQATLKPIVVGFTADMQGLLGIGGASGQGFAQTAQAANGLFGGGGGSIGNIASVGKQAGSWLGLGGSAVGGTAAAGYAGALGSATGAYGGWAGSAAAGAASAGGTGIMASMGSALSAAGPWAAAIAAIDGIFDIGIMDGIGKAVDGIKTGLFGGDWHTTSHGINLGVEGDSVVGRNYERRKKKGGWFGSSKHVSEYSPLDAELQGALQGAYSEATNSIQSALDVLGYQENALSGFSVALKGWDTSDMDGDEVQSVIGEWMSDVVSQAAEYAIGDVSGFAREGESSIGTIGRLATSLSTVNPMLETLGLALFDTSLSGADMASNMADLVGGVQNLAPLQSSYYQAFFTEAERAANLQSDLTDTLAEQNLELPETRDAYRKLVEAQDLSTEAGRENYAVLLQLAGGFDQLQSSAGGMAEAIHARESLERDLLKAQGDTDALRERELDQLMELNGAEEKGVAALQKRVWALQDEKKAADAIGNISGGIEGARESIFLDQLGGDKERYGYQRDKAEGVAASIGDLSSISAVEDAVNDATRRANRAYGLLDDAQKKDMSGEFLTFFDDLETSSVNRVEKVNKQQAEANAQMISKAVSEEVGRIGDAIINALNKRDAGSEEVVKAIQSLGSSPKYKEVNV